MENKLKQCPRQCRIVLEPISPQEDSNNVKISGVNHYKNQEKQISPYKVRSVKNISCNSHNGSEFVKPCLVELVNIGTPNGKCEKRNMFDTHKQDKLQIEVNMNIKTGVPYEPVTPKAPIEFSLELKKAINERNILTSKTKKHVFDALDEIKSKTEEERRTFKKERALLEIINSEVKYIHQLELIINFFMKPTIERNLLKPDDYNIVFRNISTIYNVNRELMNELDKGVDNIAKAFSKIAPFMKLYSVYAYEFKNALKILQTARLLNPQFASFIENQETRPEVQNKLSALLITPIQRIPRYKLLLTNLYNLTKPSEKGFDILSDCLEKIEEVAEHINKIVEDQENMQRLLEFQRCLRGEPNIITPGRKLIKEGTLMKMSTKNSHSEKLYVVLMNDIIIFTRMKKDEPKVNSLKCLSIFPLNKCKIVEILDKGCLKVVCQNEELILYHDQFSETKNWISTIKAVIDDHVKDRKTLRKESSARRPVKRKDLHEYHEVGLSPGKPLKKRRLDAGSEDCGPYRTILKRRPIRAVSEEINEGSNLPRSVFTTESTATITSDATDNGHKIPELGKDLCVFGNTNENQGFRFGKFIGDVGSTIKKFLGFRN